MDKTQIEILENLTSILTHLTVLAASIIAIIKLKLYRLLEHRYRSEFHATHIELSDGHVLFEGDYVIHNTGDRPIKLTKVELRMYGVKKTNGQLVIDEDKDIFQRVITGDTQDLETLMNIQSGERTIFTLRCELPPSEEMVFIRADLNGLIAEGRGHIFRFMLKDAARHLLCRKAA